jgi:8-oxo-dGTP diphosphatase
MISVAAAIIEKDDTVLIAKRAAHKSQAGYWEFPGGKIESNETGEACLRRELLEELNITVEVNGFFVENEHTYDNNTILLKAYMCNFQYGEIVLVDHDQAEWVKKEDLNTYNWAPADIPIVKHYISSNA